MKKSKKNNLFKFIFMIFLFSFLVVYFSEMTGYYEYQNHKKTTLTEEQIRKFEEDVSNGKQVDISNYLIADKVHYNNKLSKLTSKLSDGISSVVESGVRQTFKLLSKFIEE